MEEGGGLPPPLAGGDGDDEDEDDLLRQAEGAGVEQAGDRAEAEVRGAEPDDERRDAAELRRLSQRRGRRSLPTLIYATTPACYELPRPCLLRTVRRQSLSRTSLLFSMGVG